MTQFLEKLAGMKVFRRRNESSDPLRRCLYVTADPELSVAFATTTKIPGWTIDCTNWDDEQGPNWFLFDALILEVPASAEYLVRFTLDLEEAEAAGLRRIWLLQPRTDAAIATRVCGVEVTRPRRPLSPPPAGGRAATYLASITEIALVLRPPSGAEAVWPVGSSGRWAAGYVVASPSDPVSVVPANDRPAIEHLEALLRSTAPATAPVRFKVTESAAVYAAFAIVLLVAVSTAALRYYQRNFNIAYITTAGGTLYTASYLDDPEESNPVGSTLRGSAGDFVAVLDDPAKQRSPRRVATLFELGLFQQATKGLEALLARDNPRRCEQGQEVGEELQRLAISSLEVGNRGQARLFAQSHVNLMYRLACRPRHDFADALTRSQTILDMTRQAYISGDNIQVARMLLDPDREDDLPTPSSVDPSLADNVSYAQIAQSVAEEDSPPSDRVLRWREFLHQYPGSDRADEAAFNVIVAQMNQHVVSAEIGKAEWLAANEATLPMVDDFLSRYPSSYLADDAALLGLRVSATLNRRPSAEKYLRALAALSSSPDAVQELEYRLAMSLAKSVGGLFAANRVAAFCVSREVLNDTVTVAAVRSGSDPRSAEALKAAEDLVGRSDSGRALALNVMMRAFGQETNER